VARRGIGVYIGERYISIAQVEERKGRVVLSKLAIDQLPEGAVDEGIVEDPKALAEKLRGMAELEGIKRGRVGFVLPMRGVVMRTMEMPRMSERELYEAVRAEVEGYAVISGSEPAVDFEIIPESLETGFHTVDLIAAATPVETVVQYLGPLKRAGLKAAFVDPLPFAVLRAIASPEITGPDAPTIMAAVVDYQNAVILALRKGYPSFIYPIDVGSEDPKELAYELRLCCSFFRNDHPDEEVDRLLLILNSPDYEGISRRIAEEVGERAGEVDPLANVDLMEVSAEPMKTHLLSWCAALGAALRAAGLGPKLPELDLMPRSLIAKAELRRYLLKLGAAMAGTLILGIGLGEMFGGEIKTVTEQLRTVERQISELERVMGGAAALQAELRAMRDKARGYRNVLEELERRKISDIMEAVRSLVPRDLWLERLEVDRGAVTVEGRSLSEGSVFLFIDLLKGLFADEVEVSIQRESVGGVEVIAFQATFGGGEA